MKRRHLLLLLLPVLLLGCEREWRFAVLGDASVGEPGAPAPSVFSRLVERIDQREPDLVFFTGDLVYGRTLLRAETRKQYRTAQAILQGLRMPFHPVPGNHDLEGAGAREAYAARFARPPWILHHRGWTFIGLNTEAPAARGLVVGDQREWLRAQLSGEAGHRPTVLFLHRPVWPTHTREYGLHSLPQPDLHRLLVASRVKAVFSGHEHHFHEETRDGILYVITGGAGAPLLRGGFHHFVLARVSDDRVSIDVIPLEND